MKAYVINLDRKPERLEHFTSQAERLGIIFQRIAAVDGNNAEVQSSFRYLERTSKDVALGLYEFACLQSHRKAWNIFVESGDDFGLIFEDDIVLSEQFSHYNSDAWIPKRADIVRLETFRTMVKVDRHPVAVIGDRELFCLKSEVMGGGAYILRRETAQTLLAITVDAVRPVDVEMFSRSSLFFQGATILQMIPSPAIQGNRLDIYGDTKWASSSLLDERRARVKPKIQDSLAITWKFRYWNNRLRKFLSGYRDVPYR